MNTLPLVASFWNFGFPELLLFGSLVILVILVKRFIFTPVNRNKEK